MNNVSLVGRITKDPELRTTGSGNVTTTITVAINRRFTNQAGEREADFIQCVVWNKQAENVCKYCSKGSLVGVSGRIQTRNYDGKDGNKVYVTEVVAENVTFLDNKNKGSDIVDEPNVDHVETSDVSEDPFKDFGSEVVLSDDDLPF